MRDPKTHSKVIAVRREAVYKAANQALSNNDFKRYRRLHDLASEIAAAAFDEDGRIVWEYIAWTVPPHWRHTEIIPDTKEEA